MIKMPPRIPVGHQVAHRIKANFSAGKYVRTVSADRVLEIFIAAKTGMGWIENIDGTWR
jgi:hypothetical protein